MATTPQRQLTKFAPRHNGRPRYDPKWPPRHNASALCAQNSHRRHNGRPRYDSKWPPHHDASPLCSQNSHGATTGDHVTIQNCHRATRAHTIITSSSRRENNIFKLFQTREARYDCRFPLFDHNVLQVLRLPREMILSC